MSAQTNTLLNRLGFADPDKKLPRHDLACRYIAQSAVLLDLFGADSNPRAEFEFIVSKGRGQYMQHIGFADVLVTYRVPVPAGTIEVPPGFPTPTFAFETALIEVKITPVAASDLLRQVKLYHQYLPNLNAMLAVIDFPVSQSEVEMLASGGVSVLRLGADFNRWIAVQGSEAPLREV